MDYKREWVLMKILILEPFYTQFHMELARRMSSDITAFVFNYGYMIYLNDAKKVYIDKEVKNYVHSKNDFYLVKNTKTLYSETMRKIYNKEPSESDFEYMVRYVGFLKGYLSTNKIDLITMHNDLRWQHALAIEVCKDLGIRYLITERGIFRPNTTTIEFMGVNGYSSLPKDKEFYKNYNIEEKELEGYKVSVWKMLKIDIGFAFFIMLNKLADVLGLNSKIKNKKYSLSKYLEIFVRQKFGRKATNEIDTAKAYVFIPLQVNTDTQVLVHSDFKDIQEFISLVEKEFYSLYSDITLAFKVHPMERGLVNYKYDSRSLVVDGDTTELVKNSKCVVTINSTVGFEAIQQYKKVLVLGSAFFKIDGIAVCSSKESFKEDMKSVLSDQVELDYEAINSFVKYLKCEYQVNGNLFFWRKETMTAIKKKVEGKNSKRII